MKQFKFILLAGLFLFLSSCLGTSQHFGKNYTQDKYERTGHRGSSFIKVKNKWPQSTVVTVNGVNYGIAGSAKGFIFSRPGKAKILLSPGPNIVEDNLFDECYLQAVPGTDYKLILSGAIPGK